MNLSSDNSFFFFLLGHKDPQGHIGCISTLRNGTTELLSRASQGFCFNEEDIMLGSEDRCSYVLSTAEF